MKKFPPLVCLFTAVVLLSSCSPLDMPTTVSPLPLANVACNELSFYLD